MLKRLSVRTWIHICIFSAVALAANAQTKESMKTLEDFKRIKLGESTERVKKYFGKPEKDLGSGIYIYQYKLADGTLIWVGCTSTVKYVDHVVGRKKTRLVGKSQ